MVKYNNGKRENMAGTRDFINDLLNGLKKEKQDYFLLITELSDKEILNYAYSNFSTIENKQSAIFILNKLATELEIEIEKEKSQKKKIN